MPVKILLTCFRARAESGQSHPELHAGVTVHRPSKRSGWYDLDAGEWIVEAPATDPGPGRLAAIEQRLATIEALLRRMDDRLNA